MESQSVVAQFSRASQYNGITYRHFPYILFLRDFIFKKTLFEKLRIIFSAQKTTHCVVTFVNGTSKIMTFDWFHLTKYEAKLGWLFNPLVPSVLHTGRLSKISI